jgi:GDP-L-fucose synthase
MHEIGERLKDARVVVTGGTGFLGSHLRAVAEGHGIENARYLGSRDYNLVDPAECARLIEAERPDVLIHAAAVCGGIGANRDEPGRFFYENASMGIHLMEAARQGGVGKFVQIGTVCSYPKFAPSPFQEAEIWNGYPEETNAPYGLAKKILLVQLEAYRQQYGFNGVCVIPVNLYGPRDNFDLRTSHVIPALIRKFDEAKSSGARSVTCWGDGTPTREFLYAADAAEGIFLAASKLETSEPVNLGTGEEISIRDLSELIASLVGYDGEVVWDVDKPNGQPRRRLDVTRARELLGFEAKTKLKEGIESTVAWYRDSALPSAR